MKQGLDKDIEQIKRDVNEVELSCGEAIEALKRSYAGVVTASAEGSFNTRANNIVIRNMRECPEEQVHETEVKRKVERLVRDGLKAPDVKIVEARRKPGRGDRPGVIIATVETTEQKSRIMKSKVNLRHSRDYGSVYIDNDLSQSELQTQSSLRTILREIGKDRQYIVNGSKLVQRTERRDTTRNHNTDYDNRRDRYSERPADSTNRARRDNTHRSDNRDGYSGYRSEPRNGRGRRH